MYICPNVAEEKNAYIEWLYNKVMPEGQHNGYSYLQVLLELRNTPFTYSEPLDEARMDDGRDLRKEYMDENRCRYLEDILMGEDPVSFLEVLVALAGRASFEVCDRWTIRDAFAEILDNCGLLGYDDDQFVSVNVIHDMRKRVHDIMNRNYDSSGNGGLFPIKHPYRDQQHLPMFEQMEDYINENFA